MTLRPNGIDRRGVLASSAASRPLGAHGALAQGTSRGCKPIASIVRHWSGAPPAKDG